MTEPSNGPASQPVATAAEAFDGGNTIGITVEVADASRLRDLSPAWRDLVRRAAEPNVFMEPAMLQAASETSTAGRIWVLLAWEGGRSQLDRPLLGLLAFALGRPKSRVPIRLLRVPPHEYAFLGTPVIDAHCTRPVLAAMLDALTSDPRLPNIMLLSDITIDGPIMTALHDVLHARSSTPVFLNRTVRPVLRSDLDGKAYLERSVSSGTRKKLRQHRRRLADHGTVTAVRHREPEEVSAAFEEFLKMEASGWKGQRGTALLSDPRAAAYTRDFITALARDGLATIEVLRVGHRPVAMQVLLRSGTGAFTWKTAYDERFRDFSPGILLLEDLTATLLADEQIKVADSCCYNDGGYMADFWKERQPVGDVLIEVRGGLSWSLTTTAFCESAYRLARGAVKAAYIRLDLTIWRQLKSRLGLSLMR